MHKAPQQAVSISQSPDKATLSQGQKTFNSLIGRIEKRRSRLRAWESVMPAFQRKYVDELLPLEQASTDLQVKMVYRLDDASAWKGLSKIEQRSISELIAGLAGELIERSGDAQLKAIYNRHGQSDYDSEAAVESEDMKRALEAMLGVELGDDLDMNSPDEVLQRAQAKLEERQSQDAAENQAREARRANRKKSAKQLAAEAKREAEQAELGQSIRDVYRKLASALHPDREPDPLEQARKTALMQKVNQAYGKNDLLKLLELQLELEHIDQNAIDGISEERLKHYNKILKEQLGELDQEIRHVETDFRCTYGISPFINIAPETALRNLAKDIAAFRQDIRDFERDLRVFDDIKQFKAWLKHLKRRPAATHFDELLF